jgi:16S rRNA (cytidine1402-2'-O)-methyltransferase
MLVKACLKAQIQVIPVAGPSAITMAMSASGLVADQFLFLGFMPKRGSARQTLLKEIAASWRPVLLFESPQRIERLLTELAGLCDANREVVVAREMSKHFEEVRCQTIATWIKQPPEAVGEFTVVVQPADEPDRDKMLKERFAFYREKTSLPIDAILQVLGAEFNTQPKRLRYKLIGK